MIINEEGVHLSGTPTYLTDLIFPKACYFFRSVSIKSCEEIRSDCHRFIKGGDIRIALGTDMPDNAGDVVL